MIGQECHQCDRLSYTTSRCSARDDRRTQRTLVPGFLSSTVALSCGFTWSDSYIAIASISIDGSGLHRIACMPVDAGKGSRPYCWKNSVRISLKAA